jgi:hypothetical protein
LLPLCDRHWDFVDIMRREGWDVVAPRLEFEAAFAEGEEDARQYRRYVIESTKVKLANPNTRFRLPEGEPYSTEFLDQLRIRRDEQLNGRYSAGDRPLWANELDPSVRRMERLRYSNRAEFDRRFAGVEADQQQRRVREIALHVSGISRDFSGELDRPARFYHAVLQRESAPMGFSFDTARSGGDVVVLSKELVEGWNLCLTPEPLVWFPGKKQGRAPIILSLQAARHRRPVRSAKWDQVLIVEHARLVRHFDFLYDRFASLDELEAIVMARTFLLSLVIGDIEAGLQAGLAKGLLSPGE